MDNIYECNKTEIENNLKIIWDYMKLEQPLEKSDLIIGCGCADLSIPIKCSSLLKEGYASKILFTGGFGKITKKSFDQPEAFIYQELALKCGVNEKDILIETKSTNTGDNFRFALEVLNQHNIKCDKILIVHKPFYERRTLSAAQAILKNKHLRITSPDMTFLEYLNQLGKKSHEEIVDEISVIIGNIQRMIVYPQFGWQIENDVPELVRHSYYCLKELGFSKYILSEDQIRELINKHGIMEGKNEVYFG